MPIEQQPPNVVPAYLEQAPLKTANQPIDESYALELVNSTYWQYELYRTQNHDRRWSTHDSLYFGYVPPRVWDGTNVARASYTQPIVFDQVEAALPIIVNNIFGVGPDWFSVEAMPGTDVHEAQQVQDAISYVLEHPKDELGSSAIAELKLAFRSILLYGNGGVSVEWDAVNQRPAVEWVDIRDFYMDPGLMVPDIEESRSVVRRKFMTIDDLLQLKKDPRMSIPPANVLWYMAKNVPQAPAEQTKRIQEALRNIYYSPGFSDYIPLPADHKVEVLIYYSKSRIIWVLNKEWVAFNGPNPYGFIPFAFAPCYTVPGRFYAQSIADVQENNQRYTEALLNGHLDELTLALHPPRVQKRNTLITPAQQKWRPGAVFSADSKDDVSLLQVNTQTTNVFEDVQYLANSADRRTGINAMGQGGVPTPSNANRTLGGMQLQQGGSSSRISEIVSNIELYLITPVLYKLYKLIQFHTYPGQVLPATGEQGSYYAVDASTFQKKVRFRMLAASKMVTRDKLMQIVPFWMQTLSQGNMIGALQQMGQTVDFQEVFRMLQDATGVAHLYNLVRPMNQQEQQAKQQPPPEVQQQQQQAQQEQQTRVQLMQMKVQGDLQKEQIKKQPDFWQQQIDQQKAQQDAQARQQEMAADMEQRKQELQQQQLMNMINAAAKREQNKMDLQKKMMDVQVKAHDSQNQRQQSQMDHQLKMAQMMQMLQAQNAQAQGEQQIAEQNPKSQSANPGAGMGQGQANGTEPKQANNAKRPTTGTQGRHKAQPPK